MTIIRINDDLHKQVGDLIEKGDRIKHPSIKNFIDKAIQEKLDREKKSK